MLNRRQIISSLLALSAFPSASWSDVGNPEYLSTLKNASGDFFLKGFSSNGTVVFSIPLPARGHAVVAHPSKPKAVVFARRPGNYAMVLNCCDGSILQRLEAPLGSHFYGHGTFLDSGKTLCTTENNYSTGRGRIGFWDAERGYQRLYDIDSGGVGPHQLLSLKDQKTLVVANGGIRTHPKHGRKKLNLDIMRSNLTYLTPEGDFLGKLEIEEKFHHLSIRHLDINDNDQVIFAMQWEGKQDYYGPLVGMHIIGGVCRYIEAPEPEQIKMKAYTGSICYNSNGDRFAISSPRGGRVQIFSGTGDFLRGWSNIDVSGLAPLKEGFMITTGNGRIAKLSVMEEMVISQSTLHWDNHLLRLRKSSC